MNDSVIHLRCYVDDFFLAVDELNNIDNKEVKYLIRISENVKIDDYENLFDLFIDIELYKDVILGLELNLSSKVDSCNFLKLITFLGNIKNKFCLTLNLGNLEVFDTEQLYLLKEMNSNICMKLKINQSYEGKNRENNDYDNIYDFSELISIKDKMSGIINRIPKDYNELEKILFIYMYLGKKVNYDDDIAELDYEFRNPIDSKSIYNILFYNRGVCSGIAVTFRILMNAIGVECQVVSSLEHEWNVVKINGYWYHLDLTGDLYNIKYNYNLEYFLKSERNILKDGEHQICSFYSDEEDIAKRSISCNRYMKKLVNY